MLENNSNKGAFKLINLSELNISGSSKILREKFYKSAIDSC